MLKFAINKLDRKLDRPGHGHSDLYNITFEDVQRFLRFDMRMIYLSLLIQFSARKKAWP